MHTMNFVSPRQARVLQSGDQGLNSSQCALVLGTWLSFMLVMALAFLMAWAGR